MHFNDAPLTRPVCYQRKTKTKGSPRSPLFVCLLFARFAPDLLQTAGLWCFRTCKNDSFANVSVRWFFYLFLFSKTDLRLPTSTSPISSDRGSPRSSGLQISAKTQRSPWFCSHYPEAALILAFGACRVALSRSSVPTASASHRFHQQAGNSFWHPSPSDSLRWKSSPLPTSDFTQLSYCAVTN